ncbi:MAG: phosphoenolpyruvate--protein phosphotransferase [Bdellovibrionales bacterium]
MAHQIKFIAPIDGQVLKITQVPDPVFAQKLVGDGIAIDPTSQVLRSPCAGKVVQLHPARHAISIETDDAIQVLMHIGLDTVKLKGEGFSPRVQVGHRVEVGQPLIVFDADLVAEKARSLITVMVITEASEYKLRVESAGFARAGEDVLLTLSPKDDVAPRAEAMAGMDTLVESEPILLNLPTGLHARPAALLVGMAKSYQSNVELRKEDGRVGNAKSVVSLLGLEIENGAKVRVVAKGTDARRATDELAEFLRDLEDTPPSASRPPPRLESPPRKGTEKLIVGIGVSPGLAIGRIHQIRTEKLNFSEQPTGTPAQEKNRLTAALEAATRELQELAAKLQTQVDKAQAAIFAAHQELLEDPDILQLAQDEIERGKSAAYAWDRAISTHANRLAGLNNELLANRANDLRDVGRRVLAHLVDGKRGRSLHLTFDQAILVAENLTPSETVQLDRAQVFGFCTTTGGATSHVAILARSLGLPALAAVERRILEIPEGTEVILDGDQGEIRLAPTQEEKTRVERIQKDQAHKRQEALQLAHKPAQTRDGHKVEILANIGSVADARKAVEMGCDGVGLLRSEFLFLERETAPSEDEQYRVYQEIVDVLDGRPLTIRTLDVGGDKPLAYLPIEPEENPFLGVRGLRVGLRHPEILREQLRAILRVKGRGPVQVMFPMVASIEEFRQARMILEEERQKLGAAPVKVGIMVEVPSVAILADVFAREVDFFSIGTNDLTQYTLAMDRGHKDLAKDVDGWHPSVLRLIQMSVQAAHRYGKPVDVCGGLASDLKAVGILVGLGVDELSVSVPSIPLVKSEVRNSDWTGVQQLAAEAVLCRNADEVRELEQLKRVQKKSETEGINHVDSADLVLVPAEDR